MKGTIVALRQAKTYGEIKEALIAYAEGLGFIGFTLALFVRRSIMSPEGFVLTSYPMDWVEQYIDRNYSRIDPFLSIPALLTEPMYWVDFLALLPESEERDAFCKEANSHGLYSGVVEVVRGPGTISKLSLASDIEPPGPHYGDQRILADISMVANIAHEVFFKILREAGKLYYPTLTPREIEVLRLSADGASAAETAKKLGLSERTINFHLHQAAKKLGSSCKQQTISLALSLGLLEKLDNAKLNLISD